VDHRVAARLRQAGVEHLDHDIGHGQRLAGLLAGRGHVAGNHWMDIVFLFFSRQ
jgi:hypothetical protein